MTYQSTFNIKITTVIIFLLFFRVLSDFFKKIIMVDITKIGSLLLFSFLLFVISVNILKFPKLDIIKKFIFIISTGMVVGLINFTVYDLPIFNTLISTFRYTTPILIVILFYSYTNNQNYKRNIKLLTTLLIMCVTFLNMIILLTGNGFTEIQGAVRFEGIFSNPNVAGGYSNFVSIIAISLLFTNLLSKYMKIYLFFTIILLYVIIYKSGSLTSLLSNIIALSFLLLQYKKSMILLYIFIMGLAVYFLSDMLLPRLMMVIDVKNMSIGEGSSLLWRYLAWKEYISLIDLPHFFNGYGIGFQRTVFMDSNILNKNLFLAPGSHNDYLGVFMDFGIIGFLFFIGLLNFLYKQLRNNKVCRYFSSVLIAIAVSMFFDNYIDSFIIFVVASFYGVFLKIGHINEKPPEFNQ